MIYYANNGTVQNSNTALTSGWIGPSVTPLTNLNSGYRVDSKTWFLVLILQKLKNSEADCILRMYEVDTGSFDIYDANTFYSAVNTYSSLNSTGPTYKFEYSTREAYASAINWPSSAPLNATFWHGLTVAMESNKSLVETFNTYQGKSSVRSPNCTSDACQQAKVCWYEIWECGVGEGLPAGVCKCAESLYWEELLSR